MHVFHRDRVLGQTAMVLAVGLGQTSLGVQQQIERRFLGLKLRLDRVQLDACRVEPVERSLRNDIGPMYVGHSRSDFMQHLMFLLPQDGSFSAKLKFGISGGGKPASETDRHAQFQTELPLLEVAAGQIFVSIVEAGVVVVGIQ